MLRDRDCTPPPHACVHALHSPKSDMAQSTGAGVGAPVGALVGLLVGAEVGASVGANVGAVVGIAVGLAVMSRHSSRWAAKPLSHVWAHDAASPCAPRDEWCAFWFGVLHSTHMPAEL